VLRQVRAHPTLNDLRVIMLTAVANTPRFREIGRYHPDGFIEKPFHIGDLIEQVKRLLAPDQPA
jgi:CheY-like chemotaxis protein